jgi:hypothetical protein
LNILSIHSNEKTLQLSVAVYYKKIVFVRYSAPSAAFALAVGAGRFPLLNLPRVLVLQVPLAPRAVTLKPLRPALLPRTPTLSHALAPFVRTPQGQVVRVLTPASTLIQNIVMAATVTLETRAASSGVGDAQSRKYSCLLCGSHFQRTSSVVEHVVEIHTVQPDDIQKNIVILPLIIHPKVDNFVSKKRKVPDCLLVMASDALDAKAANTIPIRKNRLFLCTECNLNFFTSKYAVNHVSSVHDVDIDSIADKVSISERQIEKHDRKCSTCGFVVSRGSRSDYIYYHMFFNHGTPLPPNYPSPKCKHCDKVFINTLHLNQHVRQHH